MRRSVILVVLGLLVVMAGGVWLYDWVLGDTEEPSGPISAVPLSFVTAIPALTSVSSAETSNVTRTENPTLTPVAEAAQGFALDFLLFKIVQAESEARFIISEVLNGQPKEVVGATDQMAGEVAVDPNDLSTAQVGIIQVNARSLITDDVRRNQAIRNRILYTDQYEFITFTPTEVKNLSGKAEQGAVYLFQIVGDLTIRDVSRTVVFEATVVANSPERLTGFASTEINRTDFNLTIPSVPFVANVGEQVRLEIDFVLERFER